MSKFTSIKAQRVSADVTTEYTFHRITVNGVSPTLIVRPAAEVNKSYYNALLRRIARSQARSKAGAQIDAGTIAENRAEDRELYPQFIVTGWKDTIGDDGKEVPFSQADAKDFLSAIDDFEFDELRAFCSTLTNFSDGVDIKVVAEETAGN